MRLWITHDRKTNHPENHNNPNQESLFISRDYTI